MGKPFIQMCKINIPQISTLGLKVKDSDFAYSEVPNRRADQNKQAGLEKNSPRLLFYYMITLISLISVEVGINVEGVQKLPNH